MMRRLRPKPSALCFRLFVAAAAFAVGLAAWGLWPRQGGPACAPLLVEVRTQNRQGRFDSFEYETCRGRPDFGGRYENAAYGFSFATPGGAGSATPTPDGGYLGVTPFARGQFDEAVNARLSELRERGANVRLRSATPTRLAGLSAVRVVATYEQGGVEMLSDEIVAFRGEGGGAAAVVYTLDLSTRLADYERDRPILEEMRQTWRLQTPR